VAKSFYDMSYVLSINIDRRHTISEQNSELQPKICCKDSISKKNYRTTVAALTLILVSISIPKKVLKLPAKATERINHINDDNPAKNTEASKPFRMG
jgi:hypothetical protein